MGGRGCLGDTTLPSEPSLTRAVGGWGHLSFSAAPPSLRLHRANALEEQLKEQELRACEMALEEARRHRELVCRMERERSIEVESLQARWGVQPQWLPLPAHPVS